MIKLWNLQEIDQNWNAANGNLEPYITLRGHTGQILSATTRNDLLFTGGKDGVVKVWQLP
jgi:WD40 repeat protein